MTVKIKLAFSVKSVLFSRVITYVIGV